MERLLERVRARDTVALDELLGGCRALLRQVVELRLDRRLRARVDASDVVQEVQLEVARRLEDYLARQPMPFALWLRKTALENVIRIRRQHVEAECRTVERELPLPDGSSAQLGRQVLARAQTPSQQVRQRELAQLMRQAVAQLPETEQEIILMRNFEGLSNQEASQVLDVDPATASRRYGRALLRLRALLRASGVGGSET